MSKHNSYIITDKMSTSVDKGVLTRKLGASDYSPVKYVAEISTRCVGKKS